MNRSLRVPLLAALVALALLGAATTARAQAVHITTRPDGLVAGTLDVPVVAAAPVARLELFVNGVRRNAVVGTQMTTRLNVGYYIRRLRVRAVGYDAQGNAVGEDEIVVNDPRPPFRVRLQGPAVWPGATVAGPRVAPDGGAGTGGAPVAAAAAAAATVVAPTASAAPGAAPPRPVTLDASVLAPPEMRLAGVDFYVGEEKVATATAPPFTATVDASRFPDAAYARVVARSAAGEEVNDVLFFGDQPHAAAEVTMQQIPVSVVGGDAPLRADQIRLEDEGAPRRVDGLVAAESQPLHVILLIDYSQSMIEELPVVKAAAREFARDLLRPQDRLAVVGFNQRAFWLTGWVHDPEIVARAVERMRPMGTTHLYDSVVQMLYAIQKTPGRHALVVFTDGADQGSRFQIDHLVHYARYAGVPIYPVIKNRVLSRWMRFGVGRLATRRVASLADETGATWFLIQKESELADVYAKIARELRAQYQVVFEAEANMPDQWRALRVSSTGGQKLRAPLGYFP